MNRQMVILFAALGTGMFHGNETVYAQAEDRVATLKAMWAGQRQEIASAYIRCRRFRSAGLSGVSYSQLQKLLNSVDLTKNPNDLRSVIVGICPRLINVEPPWSIVEYSFQGAKVKEITLNSDLQISDGQVTTIFQSANGPQAQLYNAGDSNRYIGDLNDFRYVPKSENLKFETRAGKLLTFRELVQWQGLNFPDEIHKHVVEADTGMVREYTVESTAGKIERAVIQNHFVDYSGGIRFPSLVIQATFEDSRLSWATITQIEVARFNEELPKDTFRLSVPAGTRVFDRRNSDSSNFEATAAADDVVQLASELPIALNDPLPTRDTSGSRARFLAALFVFAIALAAAAVFARRRRLRSQ